MTHPPAHWPAGLPLEPSAPRSTLPLALDASAQRFPDKPAIIFGDQVLSYRQLQERSDALAGHLQHQHGVQPGDRVLIVGQNSPHWVVACYGALRAGAVVVPVNPMSKAAEIRHLMQDSGARLVLAARDYTAGLPAELAVVVMDEAWPPSPATPPPGPVPTDPDALALLPYTSGTTGAPKGCRHSHATLLASLASSAAWKPVTAQSVVLTVAPLFHMLGLQNGMNLPILQGATAVMLPRWNAQAAADAIERHRVTAWSAPPAMVMDLFAQPGSDQRDFSSLKLLSGGGAAMPDAVAAMLKARFGLVYQEAYGLTETASFLHANPPQRCKRQCLGVPTQGVDSRIVDPDSLAELPQGAVGELVTQAPQLMLGYWRNPEADAQAFVHLDGKRFFRTGDLACVDEDGYFFLKDRLKRMINVSGYKVWPAEVENMLYDHPAVAEACVVAVPDARSGEAVRALLVCKPGATLAAEEFIAWCRGCMAVYKAPRSVVFMPALPKSPTGKVAWRELQQAQREENVP